jgi:hypothetical protein
MRTSGARVERKRLLPAQTRSVGVISLAAVMGDSIPFQSEPITPATQVNTLALTFLADGS